MARLPEARLAPATARFGTRSDVTVVGLAAGAAGVGLLATVAPVAALALTALLVLAALMATDADLEKSIKMFGSDTTERAAFVTALNHLHEHLGQAIAYARMNGVVPPWSGKE